MEKLPNELECQLFNIYGKNIFNEWEKLNDKQKLAEIVWCIERCYMNSAEYPEKRTYFHSQIKKLEKLKNQIKGN